MSLERHKGELALQQVLAHVGKQLRDVIENRMDPRTGRNYVDSKTDPEVAQARRALMRLFKADADLAVQVLIQVDAAGQPGGQTQSVDPARLSCYVLLDKEYLK